MQNEVPSSSRCNVVSDPRGSEAAKVSPLAAERKTLGTHPLIADALAENKADAVSWTKA